MFATVSSRRSAENENIGEVSDQIDSESEVVLNERRFGVSADGQSLSEWTHSRHYQDGAPFCNNETVSFIRDDSERRQNRIVIGGACYGLLYLPRLALRSDGELQLLSSRWSSITMDSALSVESLVAAANDAASIVFRDDVESSMVTVALTDSAFLEMKEVVDADYVSMITLHGATIDVHSLSECNVVDLAARNHSRIQSDSVLNVQSLFLELEHTATVRMHRIVDTQLTLRRQQMTQITLPQHQHLDEHGHNETAFPLLRRIQFGAE